MKTVSFIRHGEAESNIGGPLIKYDGVSVTRRGALQACLTSYALKRFGPIGCVIMSPMLRAEQSAMPILDRSGKIPNREDPRVGDFQYLSSTYIQGKIDEEIAKRAARDKIDYWLNSDPSFRVNKDPTTGTESFSELISRVKDFIAEIPAFPEENICVFTHGYVITAIETLMQNPHATDKELLQLFKQQAFKEITEKGIIRSPKHVKNGEIIETCINPDNTMSIVGRHTGHLAVLENISAEAMETVTLQEVRALSARSTGKAARRME